jgi:hypothetical protein
MKLTTYPYGGLGSQSIAGGTIHTAGCSSTFGTSWPPFMSSFRANLVTVERLHDSGSSTVMGCGRAIEIDRGTRRRGGH